ncbi:MAG: hypothetical protein M1840_007202 [Geoglossum simile]|nr:MAG: hypothetical protein M1840_007202 [Geoglossum simile]
MAPLQIIPYDPARAIAGRRPRKPSILPGDAPRSQAITVAGSSHSSSDGDQGSHHSELASRGQNQTCVQNSMGGVAPVFVGGSEEASGAENVWDELRSRFSETDSVVETENGFVTKAGDAFAKASAEPEASGAEVQDSDEEFGANSLENGMRGNRHLLKRKLKNGGQGNNPLVIMDDGSNDDSESEDDFMWKKRKVSQDPWLRTADDTDDETDGEDDGTKFGVSCTKARVRDSRSESDGIASQIEDFASNPTDLVEPNPVARVGCNGEWGIHGIIGKEVIQGVIYYCVDWEPTMLPKDVLRGARRMVQEFEAKEQARGKGGDSRKRKQVGRGKHRF